MKQTYKGYKIDVYREECLLGDDLLYVFVESPEGLIIKDDAIDCGDTVRDMMQYMKNFVDSYIDEQEHIFRYSADI